MIQIVLNNAEVQIGDGGPAVKVLQFVDNQSGIMVTVPMDRLSAINVGLALAGKVTIAEPANGNGNTHAKEGY